MLVSSVVNDPHGTIAVFSMIPLTSPYIARNYQVSTFAVFAFSIGILMYGKTNMERAVQMVAILVEIKFGERMA
jgi:hypothetical protein